MESLEDTRKPFYVFADDLFRYLLSKRVDLTDFSPPLRKSHDSTPDFDPVVGLYILCISYRRQKEYFKFFAKQMPLLIDKRYFQFDYFRAFCHAASDHFNAIFENIYEKILHISSVLLELCAFCNAQGHRYLKYFSNVIWGDIIDHEMKQKSLNSDNLKELISFASDTFQAYIDENNICVDENRDPKTECLKEYDTWASMLSVDTLNGVSPLDPEPVRLKYVPNRMTPIKTLHTDVLALFIEKMMNDIGPGIEEFVRIFKNLDSTMKLMNNELYLQVMTQTIKRFGIKLNSFELFQIAKLIIRDNEILAIFCFLTSQYAKGFRTKHEIINIFSTISGESSNSTGHSRNTNAPKDSEVKSSGKSNATSKHQKSSFDEVSSKRLLREFKRLIGQDRSDPAKEICKYLKVESTCPILDDILFTKVMILTCHHFENCWEKIWILSVMKILDPQFKPKCLTVFRIFPFNTDVLVETLMGGLISKEGKKLKSSAGKNKVSSAHESKGKDIAGSMKHQLRDVIKPTCPEKVILNKKELASDKKLPLTKKETTKVWQEIYTSNPKPGKTCFHHNDSFTDKLTANEFAGGKSSSSTIKLNQNKQTLISHNDAQSETIPKDTELINFCSSKTFTEEDVVGASSSSDLCNEGGNSRVSIISTTHTPKNANISLNSEDEEIIIENKQEECTESLVAKTNGEIMGSVLPKFKILDLPIEMKALSIQNTLKSADIKEETEKKTESGMKLSNSMGNLVKESSTFQECESNLLSGSVAHGHSSSVSINPLSQANEDINELEHFVSEMKLVSNINTLKRSAINEEEAEKKTESEMKPSNSMEDLSNQCSNFQGWEMNLSNSVKHDSSSFAIMSLAQASEDINLSEDFGTEIKGLSIENILKSSDINEEKTENKIVFELLLSNSMEDLSKEFSNFQKCESNLSGSDAHGQGSSFIIPLSQASENGNQLEDSVTDVKVLSVESTLKISAINEEEIEKKIESELKLSNSLEDLAKEFSNFQGCDRNLSDSITHDTSSFSISPLSQASKDVNQLEDFTADTKVLSAENILKISINEKETEKKIESEVKPLNSMKDLPNQFSKFQGCESKLSASVTHESSSFTIIPLSQTSEDENILEEIMSEKKVHSIEKILKSSAINEEEREIELKPSNSVKDLAEEFSNFQRFKKRLLYSVTHGLGYFIVNPLSQPSKDINKLEDSVTDMKALPVKNILKSSDTNEEEVKMETESEVKPSNSMVNLSKEFLNFHGCQRNLSDSVIRAPSSFTITLSQANKEVNQLEDFVTEIKVLSDKNKLKSSGINEERTEETFETEVRPSNFQGCESDLLSDSVAHNDSSSFSIIPLSQANEGISKLEDFVTNIKDLSVENILKSSDINEEETEKKTEYEVKPSNLKKNPSKEFSNSLGFNRNLVPDSFTHGHTSFTNSVTSDAGDSINHPEDIPASEQQNSNIPYLQNLGSIPRDILSAYRNIMDTLQIDYSRETFNGTLRQIIEKNPDILETLKAKSIIDKQITRELLKYRQNFCEVNK